MATPTLPPSFTFTPETPKRGEIGNLHAALTKIGLDLPEAELKSGAVGPATTAAIEAVQKRAGLPITGKVTPDTVAAIKDELTHLYFADSKKRTAQIQAMLARVGQPVDAAEAKARTFGPSTQKLLAKFGAGAGVPLDNGRVTPALVEALRNAAITARFSTKTQIGSLQRRLARVDRIAKLNTPIDPNEFKRKAVGPTTQAALRAFQEKYELPVTGQLDAVTYERLVSVANSRPLPPKLISVKSAQLLKPIPKPLRLNMKNERVADLQRSLAFLGYPIDHKEFDVRKFGKSTRAAVVAYQRSKGLPLTGHVEKETLARLNADINKVVPAAAPTTKTTYTVRGSVRDSLWRGKGGVRVQAWQTALRGDGTLLAERKTGANGFFNLPYEPPRSSVDGTIQKPFELQVRVLDANGSQVGAKVTLNPSPTVWVNFTDGPLPYRGTSEWEAELAAITKAAGNVAVADLHETDAEKELTYVALHAGLDRDEVMRVVLSHLVSAEFAEPALTADAVYAFIGQNYPGSLPGDLVASTAAWAQIGALVETAAQGIAFMPPEAQTQVLAQAATANMIPIATIANQQAILDALASKRQMFALQKPILAGNGTLQSIIDLAQVTAGQTAIAETFVQYGGMGTAFWANVGAAANLQAADVAKLRTAAQIGAIAKHHDPTMQFLNARIASGTDPTLTSVSDTAKQTHEQWLALIAANGGQVPDGLPGDDKAAYYATSLQQQAERLFPTHALAARAATADGNALSRLADIQKLLHDNPDLDLAKTNAAAFALDKNLDADVVSELKVVQRIQRIADDAATGAALLAQKLHHSAQIVFMGPQRVTQALEAQGIATDVARATYDRAELQYAQVLARIGEYRNELQVGNPAAIAKQTYTPEEQQQLVGNVPDLEALFGAMDYCTCSTCQSLYGPAAYMSDLLRFLDSRVSEQPPKTVGGVLFDRRPDLGNIKLNCQNTETPLPYIDLVCEILEAAVPAPGADANFSFQTTRPAGELRAFPENLRAAVYDLLRTSDFPIDGVFDLWQEEARVWLNHLGVPRWQLMEWLQARPTGGSPSPADESIAAEYLALSSHETSLVTTAAADAGRQQTIWGFDCTRATVGVEEFLAHSKLDYDGLLQLTQVEWINAGGGGADVAVDRPSPSGDLSLQSVTNLTLDRFDRIHRFLRLWRKCGWAMWELDLLLRAARLGNGALDANAIAALAGAKRVQKQLGIDVDELLAFYGHLNTEARNDPRDSTRPIDPYYATLFQNARITDPVDAGLALPLAAGSLTDHRVAITAAVGVGDADFDRLAARPGANDLSEDTLARTVATVTLARTASLTIERLFMLIDLVGGDVFASPQATLDFLEARDWVTRSGIAADELDFLLGYRPDSPYGLRDDAIGELVDRMRDARRAAAAADEPAAIATAVASAFAITATQATVLLQGISAGGHTLLEVLSDAALVDRTVDNGVEVYAQAATAANFGAAFDAYRLLQKAAFVVSRQKLADTDDLAWVLTNHASHGLLDLAALPVDTDPASSLFPSWLALTKWLGLRAHYPEPEGTSWRAVFDAAGALDPNLHATLAAVTQWPQADIDTIATALQLSYTAEANDYLQPETYLRIERVAKAVKRLGVTAAGATPWTDRETDGSQQAVAQQTRAAAKSKYDSKTWLAKAGPLYDVLRERKRDALISYLVETSQRNQPATVTIAGTEYPNPQYWRDADDMLRWFCIDVEMGAMQLSSRISQAVGSIQMFVQRCFLNLEQPYVQVGEEEKADAVTMNSWRQWDYIKNYGLWAAARQIFFYPENWIEEELRDDKTPFFEELESELKQQDMTDANAETAIRHYLEKLHEVSRLTVLGMYRQTDADTTDGGLPVDLLHVVARTKTDPAIYYYRRYDFGYGTWSPWEKMDVDIVGEHILPVVYNRKLYVFWLVFNERPQKQKKQPAAQTSGNTDAPAPPKQMEIQLGWSTRTPDGWTSKKLSREKFIHPWQRPEDSYHLKTRYKSRENLLWVDLYISTSKDFNDAKFWDPFANSLAPVTSSRFDETGRPWHSSSFVFDGHVVALKMKPLRAFYHLVDATGQQGDNAVYSDSFQFVHGAFGQQGRDLLPLQGPYETGPRLPLPDGMHYRFNRLTNNVWKPNANKLNVLELGNTRTVAQGAQAPFDIVFSQDSITFDTAAFGAMPFVYQDNQRSFFVRAQWLPVTVGYNQVVQRLEYEFFPFFHPYTELYLRELDRSGPRGLLNRRLQRFPGSFFPGDTFDFKTTYAPLDQNAADATAETDIVDFELSGAYAAYNWEAFFHIPLMIATKLSQNQRFEEAMKWFHYVFDPTNVDELSQPQRYWVTRPFFEMSSDDYRKQRIENLLNDLGANLDQVRAWKNDPFNPNKIARYRPVAYQKNVVMKYIDNLIAWGDQLFGQDTLEAINQATLLYTLADELLGRRPQQVPPVPHDDYSYLELVAHGELDPLGNESVAATVENLTPPPSGPSGSSDSTPALPILDPLYFAIPANDKLLGYWDTVADRLYKIRHSMNIKGVVRTLPLFEPIPDPALLVKAAAAGVDLGDIMSIVGVDVGPYRYRPLVSTAIEFANEVKSLGDKLLAALEKRDAEQLALLRSTNEISLLQATIALRQSQIDEANANIDALNQTLAMAQAKSDYYGSRDFINAWEGTALGLSGGSALAQTAIAAGYVISGGLKLIPSFVAGGAGFGGSPTVTGEMGGQQIGNSAEMAAKTLETIATALDKYASLATTMGSYTRRKEEWDFQKSLADIEVEQTNAQIAAAQIRQSMAQTERDNLDLQIQQSQAVDVYMHSKYTNDQLYDWMVGQISTVYFQAYQLAFDMARRAQAALQYELGDDTLSFIEFGYWDSLKKGLLAAEKLSTDLRRMESSHFQLDVRDLELTKHVSLAQTMPLSLLALRDTGQCVVQLPEWLFDMDFPGHYMRRIKSVAMTVPAVVGPYGGVHATLALTRNGIRVDGSFTEGDAYGDALNPAGDARFAAVTNVPVTSIATSHGQNDNGMFELSFNDERWLPFEGAGAVSEWTISMPQAANQFDFATISDVILHVRYTARGGDVALANAATTNLNAVLPASGYRLFALKNEFADDWYRFFNPAADADQTMTVTLRPEHFPFYARGKAINVTGVDLFLEGPTGNAYEVKVAVPGAALPADAAAAPPDASYGNAPHFAENVEPASNALGDWTLELKTEAAADFKSLTSADLSNAYLVVRFATA